MKKRILVSFLAICLVLSLLIITGCTNEPYSNNDADENKTDEDTAQFLIATCPTTYAYLNKINMNDDFIVQTESTANALRLLNSNQVQIAFVGRNAYIGELNGEIIKKELFDRYTIVSKTINPLLLTELQRHNISTYISEEELTEFDYLNFNYIDKKEIHNDEFGESFFLISWSDFDELSSQGFNLINVYSGASKVDSFRNPTFFYSKQYEDVVEEISQAILQE